MLKNMSIRKRIMVILAVVYIFSMVAVIGIGYSLLQRDTEREAAEKTELFISSMLANQQYMKKFVRPDLKELAEDVYFPEASVGAVMLVKTAKLLQEQYPEYILRVSSPNPLNQENLSTSFEERIIAGFDNGDYKEWQGFTTRNGKSFYAAAVPIKVSKGCIWCHDTPEVAHPDMVAEYGDTSGYGYKLGEIVGTRIVYVPTDATKALAMTKLAYLGGTISLLFLIALIVIDRIIIRSVVKPIENIVDVAGDISRGKMDRSFDVDTNDEIKLLADAFNRMKVSLEKAINILKK